MCTNALERDKCSCFGYCYPFTGLGKLLSNPKSRCRLAPTCMFHACISPPVMWRQKKAVRSGAFVVDSESCETYLEGDQTIKISSQATPLGGFSFAFASIVVPFCSLPRRSGKYAAGIVVSRNPSPNLRRSSSRRLSLRASRDALGQSAHLQP